MKKIVLLLVLLISSSTINAQEHLELPTDSFGKITMKCLAANGVKQHYTNATNSFYAMMKQQYAGLNVPDTVWKELESEKELIVQDIQVSMIAAYKALFDVKDMSAMLAFYQSKEAQKMLTRSKSLTNDERAMIQSFYNSKSGQKMAESQESLSKMVSDMSEMWSSDLYTNTVAKLAEKGFTLP